MKARVHVSNGTEEVNQSAEMEFEAATKYAFALIRLGNIGVWVVPV